MKVFAQGRSSLSNFSVPMKLAFSFFILFILLGLVSSVALYHQQFNFSTDRASDYYQGNRGEKNVDQFHVKKSYRELLEVTHFHVFIMPVVYLALVHLYFLSSQPELEKNLMTILAFGGLLTEVAAPWLVRYGSEVWSYLFWGSGGAITVSTLWMSLVCYYCLWFADSSQG
ncbi:MAG: hypothetical protein ABEK50_11025 [bacterium]